MPYNPNIHHRKSIRLKGYDYSRAGLYYITICVKDRRCLFGNIENREMVLNDAGRMVDKWYWELENKYPDKKCHEMVIMPNHFHCIIENKAPVRVDLCVCPDISGATPIPDEHVRSPIHRAVQWFKTMTTNEYIRGVNQQGWQRFNGKLWQRNYWEHIIRDERSYQRISEYIINNPKNWGNDKFKGKE